MPKTYYFHFIVHYFNGYKLQTTQYVKKHICFYVWKTFLKDILCVVDVRKFHFNPYHFNLRTSYAPTTWNIKYENITLEFLGQSVKIQFFTTPRKSCKNGFCVVLIFPRVCSVVYVRSRFKAIWDRVFGAQ